MRKLIIASTLFLTISLPATANSICASDTRCQQADTELNKLWQSLGKTERDALRRLQQRWITNRDQACGSDTKCISEMTEKRVKLLREMTSCINNPNKAGCGTSNEITK